jgi:hypothetical protein
MTNKNNQKTQKQKQQGKAQKPKPPPVPPKPQHLRAKQSGFEHLAANEKYYIKQVAKASQGVPGGVLRALGAVVGGAGGLLMGSPFAGAKAGWDAGAGVSQWAGLGKYRIRRNVLLTSQEPANFASSSDGVIITHREYLGDLVSGTNSPTSFTTQQFDLNPSLVATFPWLSQIAQNFQEWEPLGIICEYLPQQAFSSISSTTNNLGSVFMVTQYDADQLAPVNKTAVLNEMYSVTGRPSDKLVMPIECDMSQNVFKNLFIAPGGQVPANADQKTYKLGTLFIGSQGVPYAGDILGQIWITYKIRLRKPGFLNALIPSPGPDILFSHEGATGTTVATNTNVFWNSGATGVTLFQSSVGAPPVVTASRIYFSLSSGIISQALFGTTAPPPAQRPFQLPPGLYQITCIWNGSSTAQTINGPAANGTGLAVQNYFEGNAQSSVGSGGLTGVTASLTTIVLFAPSGPANCYLEYNQTQTLPASCSKVDVLISYIGALPNAGTF